MLAIETNVDVSWSVCPSVTLVHPSEGVGLNEMPFDRNACVVPSDIIRQVGWLSKV